MMLIQPHRVADRVLCDLNRYPSKHLIAMLSSLSRFIDLFGIQSQIHC